MACEALWSSYLLEHFLLSGTNPTVKGWAGCKLDCHLLRDKRGGIEGEMEKWGRHGGQGRAHIYHGS